MLDVVEPEHCYIRHGHCKDQAGTDIVKIKMSKTDLNVELEMAGTSVGTCWKPEVYTGKSTIED